MGIYAINIEIPCDTEQSWVWRVGDFERLWNRVALTLVIDETRNDTTANYIYSAIARPSPNPPNPPPSLGGTNRPSSPPEVNWTSLRLTDDSADSFLKRMTYP